MRLMIISLMTLIFVGLALISLRFYGQLKVYQAYDHQLLVAPPNPWVIQKIEDFNQLKDSTEEWFFIQVATLPEGGAYLVNDKLEAKDLKALKTHPALEATLTDLPNKKFLIEIINNAENADLVMKAIVERTQTQNRVIIHSEFDVVNESIRKQIARGVYGIGAGDKARLKILSGIGLEGVSTLEGDVLISPIRNSRIILMTAEQRSELSRRFIKWITPLEDLSSFAEVAGLKPDAWITNQPNQLRALLAH